ncbi:MAG: sulfatase [Candidatus Diapherotrites archaeon]|nr:sulfatase [Candidatus Diapherotrites archaeon]MDZ4256755.1 sulfatase [archaeon]
MRRFLPPHIRNNLLVVFGILFLLAAFSGLFLPPVEKVHAAPYERGSVSKQDPSRPNIIFIRTDDQDYNSIFTRLPNSNKYIMQNLHNQIISKGVFFTNSYVEFSLCCPSRVTTLTGLYSKNHGVLGNKLPYGGYHKFTNTHNTLPVWLRNAGYYTILVGKYLNDTNVYDPPPPGWNRTYLTDGEAMHKYYNYKVMEDGTTLHSFGQAPGDYKTDVLTNRAVQYLADKEYGSSPFFLQIDYTAPHASPEVFGNTIPAPRHAGAMDGAPFPLSPSFNEADVSDKPAAVRSLPLIGPVQQDAIITRYKKRQETLMAVDEGIGRIIRKLKQTGQYDKTIIVFASDNGWMQGEHRIEKGKQVAYQAAGRVPLAIMGPGIPQNVTIHSLVNNVDYVPTFLEWANATSTLVPEGRSLVPLMQNPNIPWRTDFLIENPYLDFYSGLRTRDASTGEEYKYVEYDYDLDGNADEFELYALTPNACSPIGDPYELESQHNNPCYAPLLQNLHNVLMQRLACVGSTCR